MPFVSWPSIKEPDFEILTGQGHIEVNSLNNNICLKLFKCFIPTQPI